MISIDKFPKEIVELMLHRQEEQSGKKDIDVFKTNISASTYSSGNGGFSWTRTPEGSTFWSEVITGGNFERFFEKYPTKIKVEEVNEEMKIDLDTTNKIITLSGRVNLEEFINEISKLVPDWSEWTITTTTQAVAPTTTYTTYTTNTSGTITKLPF